MTIAALIVAAGQSQRFGSEKPKIYQSLCGYPVLAHSMRTLLASPYIDHVLVVIHPQHEKAYTEVVALLATHPQKHKLLLPIFGGAERHDSVRLGIEALDALSPATVLIHDGARPNLQLQLVTRIVDTLKEHVAVIPILPIYDTVKKVVDEKVHATIDRTPLRTVQTPQGFHYPLLLKLYRSPHITGGVDDALLCEQEGITVTTVAGDRHNIKITTHEDLVMLEQLLANNYRVGMGFDAHRFKEANGKEAYVMLGGIRLPHTHLLEAHSDGDVFLHALVDAMLGTIAGGDIGMHFPPSDPKWKDANSSQFVLHALAMIHAKGGSIVNVDLTLIGERPRIGEYRQAICTNIANMLQIAPNRVNMKATTTEGMGFTGRKEGLAAQAIVGVYLPSQGE